MRATNVIITNSGLMAVSGYEMIEAPKNLCLLSGKELRRKWRKINRKNKV